MLWEAVPTALVAAFSPWTLLIVAELLSRDRPVRLALVFLAVAAATALAFGFVVVLALSGTGIDNSRKHHSLPPALDVGLGLLVLAGALFVARRPPHKPKKKTRRREVGVLAVIVLGLVVGSPSPLYLTALHAIAKGDPSAGAATLDVLVIAVLVLLMAEIPIVMYLLAPQRSTSILHTANAWLAQHGRLIGVVAACAVGCYFIISGVVHLA